MKLICNILLGALSTACCLLSFQACNRMNFQEDEQDLLETSVVAIDREIVQEEEESRMALARIAVKIRNSGYRNDDVRIFLEFKNYEKMYLDFKANLDLAELGKISSHQLLDSANEFYERLFEFVETYPPSFDDWWIYDGNENENLIFRKRLELDVANYYKDAAYHLREMYGNQDIRFYMPFIIVSMSDDSLKFQVCAEGQYLAIDSLYLHPTLNISELEMASTIFHTAMLDPNSEHLMSIKYWDSRSEEANYVSIDSVRTITRIDF